LEALVKSASPEVSAVVSDWGGRLLDDLSPSCRDWLAANCARLDEEERTAIVAGLASVSGQEDLGAEQGKRYRLFMQALPEAGRNTKEMRDHVAEVARTAIQSGAIPQDQAQNQQIINNALQAAQDYLPEVMPVLASSLHSLPSSTAAQLLDRVFSEAPYIDRAPQLLSVLHSSMVENWPSPEDVDYQAQQVFERAEAALRAHPDFDRAPELLRSISSLTDAADLGSEYTARVLDVACVIWPEHPDAATEVITSYEQAPTPENLKSLVNAVQGEGDQIGSHPEQLRDIWTHCASLLGVDSQAEVVVRLMGGKPLQAQGDPDWALGTWLEALPDKAAVLKAAFLDERLADEDLERLWRRTESLASRLGFGFFRELLPELLGRPEIDKTISAVRSSREEITGLCESQKERNELARGLLEALIACPNSTGKGMLAQWTSEAKAGNVLGHLQQLRPTEADLDVLQHQFPNSSMLQEYRSGKR
jgi:hypothetical protein